MAKATLTIASKNYGSWSLRGWLLCKLAGLDFDEEPAASDDPSTRAELLLLSPSFLVPCLTHDGVKVWDTLAIAEYLNETQARRRPAAEGPRAARAHCRSISRRDAFRLYQPALGAADEPQGALSGLQGLGRRAGRHRPHRQRSGANASRAWRALPVRRQAVHGRRHVRAGGDALHHLRRQARPRLRRLLQGDHGDAGDAGMDRAAPRPSRTSSRSSTSSSSSAVCFHFCRALRNR